MRKILILTFLAGSLIFAQDEGGTPDSLLNKWIPKGVAGLNVSQISFTDWSQGGDNSITWTLTGNFGLNYETLVYHFKNDLKLAYGRTKLGDEEFKTNDNELYLETVFSYKMGWELDPYVSNTVRTALTEAYDYTDTSKIKKVDFFDPGYVSQSIGLLYDKTKGFSTRLGLAFQETFTRNLNGYADDPETAEIEDFRFETGIESVTSGEFTLQENLLFNSKLRLFTRFENLDVWDVRWDNIVTAKINDDLNVNLNVLVIYEKSQSPKTQIKQALQLGLTYVLF